MTSTRTVLPPADQDDIWTALAAAAATLTEQHSQGRDLEVFPGRRRDGHKIADGLVVANAWVDVFEAVRQRTSRGGDWYNLQTMSEAAAAVARFLEERPDQAAT